MTTKRIVGRNAITSSSLDGQREEAPAVKVIYTYRCPQGHETPVAFWEHAEVPNRWKCKVDSLFASLPGFEDVEAGRMWRPESVAYWEPKTHIEQLHERRTEAELEALLEERLQILRSRRGAQQAA